MPEMTMREFTEALQEFGTEVRAKVAEEIAQAIRQRCISERHSVSLGDPEHVCDGCQAAANLARQHATT